MIKNLHRIVGLIEGDWKSTHVLVIGDVMLDRYIWGDVERISPEAPVPIVRAAHRSEQPGGAANVAMNVVGLGAHVTIAGFAGGDADRVSLETCLAAAGVQSKLTIVNSHPTTSKLRILGGQQQILRLDVERTTAYPDGACAQLSASISALLNDVDAVVLSDYAKGVLSEALCRSVIDQARSRNIPFSSIPSIATSAATPGRRLSAQTCLSSRLRPATRARRPNLCSPLQAGCWLRLISIT